MKVCGTDVCMVRGDSESVTVRCFDGDNVRSFEAGDQVCLTVKSSYLDNSPVLQKVVSEFTDGAAIFAFAPADTSDLRVAAYKYDVALKTAEGAKTTIIPSSKFELWEDITHE